MSSNYSKQNCNCTCKSKESTCDNTFCCQGVVPVKFNVGKAKTVCAYLDVILDEKTGTGSPLFDALTTTATTYTSTLTLTNPNIACCTPCTIVEGAAFSLDTCVEAELLDLIIGTAPATTNTKVNGSDVANVEDLGNGEYLITLADANILDTSSCQTGEGRKSTLMFEQIGDWSYEAKYEFKGSVNSNGQVCKFEAAFETITPDTADTTASTVIAQDLCIPSVEAKIFVKFGGEISLINPMLTYTDADGLVLTASVVIIPKIVAEVIENKKVCLQAML